MSTTTRYADGRSQVGTSPPDPTMVMPLHPSVAVPPDDPLTWETYGLAEWLAHTWAPSVDERLDAITANSWELGDRVHRAGWILIGATVAMIIQMVAFFAIMINWG